LFCPCVKFNMNQLSEIHSKLLPTKAQHPLNSVGHFEPMTNEQLSVMAKWSTASPRMTRNARRLSP
jgi:hypothetical protein